jgi:CheY-like chemotaxis protein
MNAAPHASRTLARRTAEPGLFTNPRRALETVLAANSDSLWRKTTCRHLAELGYRTFEAEHPRAALQLLDDARIDLLLSEVDRGDGQWDGISLARVARERYPALRILLTAGLPHFKLASFAELDCAAAFLSQPYRKEDLASALHGALDA